MASAQGKVMAARTALVLDQPFFGALALRLKVVEDAKCHTAWTDGISLGYNPKFVDKLKHSELTALIAHEVMHCANGHPWRRDAREMKKWNVACDAAINGILTSAGFTLPQGGIVPTSDQQGKSAEWIYARLPEDQGGSGQGKGEDKPDPLGEVRDAPGDSGEETGSSGESSGTTEADWQQAVQQAANQAKAMGGLPAGAERFAKDSARPKVDWKSVLRRFIQERACNDYTWMRPNKRYIAQGLYLPSLESHETGHIAVAIDTSGSIDEVLLNAAKAELLAVTDETQPSRVTVYYADASVAHVDTFEKGEPITFRPKGGGGTDFAPVLAACENQDEPPICIIYLTDMFGHFPEACGIPVLWVTNTACEAPFGEVVRVED